MDFTGHLRIDKKKVAFSMKEGKVVLIYDDQFSALFPTMVCEKEIIKGVTTGNREIVFIKSRYNKTALAYGAYAYSCGNTGYISDITTFDKICFYGKPINVFAGLNKAFNVNKKKDIINHIMSIEQQWISNSNYSTQIKWNRRDIQLSIEYDIVSDSEYDDEYIRKTVPKISLKFPKIINIKEFPDIYLMVYDFFVFLNFRRNIKFDKIVLQRKDEDAFKDLANVIIFDKDDSNTYDNTERNSITLQQCKEEFGKLFMSVTTRRKRNIYDSFYIPEDSSKHRVVTYEKYLSCALSFESEYTRTHVNKKTVNEKFAKVHDTFGESLEKMEYLYEKIQSGELSFQDFKAIFLREVDYDYKKLISEFSKTRQRDYSKYYKKIIDELERIDFSLQEKYSNALKEYTYIIEEIKNRLTKHNKVELDSESKAGELFAGMRNSIAHGEPLEIEPIHCVLFELARVLIYINIFYSVGIEDERIKEIVNKIF
ncbi:MAG: hypothetical protein IJA34_08965 [Lachnospiraceae bacterium]|nr:hypothetical protein [Lachnospiraceae bacterium]